MTEQEVREPGSRWRTIFEVSSTLLMLALASALVWQGRAEFFRSPDAKQGRRTGPPPTNPIDIGESATLGSASAQVAIIEYSDFQCSACAEFARDVKPALLHEYVDDGRVVLVFKNFPLAIHPRAPAAAEAAWCAGRQGKFWQMHDRLFILPAKLNDPDLRTTATDIGLDVARYDSCRARSEASQRVQVDRSEAVALKVAGTPTFYFGRTRGNRRVQVSDAITGASSIKTFRIVLDRLLK